MANNNSANTYIKLLPRLQIAPHCRAVRNQNKYYSVNGYVFLVEEISHKSACNTSKLG